MISGGLAGAISAAFTYDKYDDIKDLEIIIEKLIWYQQITNETLMRCNKLMDLIREQMKNL